MLVDKIIKVESATKKYRVEKVNNHIGIMNTKTKEDFKVEGKYKMRINTKLVLCVSLLFLALYSMPVQALQPPPLPGASFETAPVVRPGTYNFGTVRDEAKYVQIEVKPGQKLNVVITIPRGSNRILEAFIYDETRRQVGQLYEMVDGPTVKNLFYVPGNLGQAMSKYYIAVGSDHGALENVSVKLSLEDVSDAGSGTDAGEDFEHALAIQPGSYSGFLAGDEGSDHKDFYRVSLSKNQKLTMKITPAADAAYLLTIYDADRRAVEKVFPENPGQILTASWIAPSRQDAYVEVDYSGSPSRNYKFEIALTQPLPEEIKQIKEEIRPPTGFPEFPEAKEEVEREGAQRGGANWWWIMIILIVIAGAAFWYIRKQKEGKK